MNTLRFTAPVMAMVALAVTACAQQGGHNSASTAADVSTPPTATVSPAGGSVTGEVPSNLLSDILEQASADSGLEPSEIAVVTAEAVTWSDGSLGCPEPGMMYTQALVPGYRVVVDAGGDELHFHASEREFAFCKDPQPPARTNE